MAIELDPVDRITADAVGLPGERTFYLQARKGDHLVTLLVEKQQVQLLAASVVEILARIGKETGQGPNEEAMELEQPVMPEWRAGRLSIGYLEDRDLVMLEAEEIVPDTASEEQGQSGERDDLEALGLGRELQIQTEEAGGQEAEEGKEGEGEGEAVEAVEVEPLVEKEPARAAGAGEARPEPERVRFWATREQMLSLARHGALVCAAGRPRCQFCGNPVEPEGHVCPAMNGHRNLDGE